jgi:hypothetical protein
MPLAVETHSPYSGNVDDSLLVFFRRSLGVRRRIQRHPDVLAGDGGQEIHGPGRLSVRLGGGFLRFSAVVLNARNLVEEMSGAKLAKRQ